MMEQYPYKKNMINSEISNIELQLKLSQTEVFYPLSEFKLFDEILFTKRTKNYASSRVREQLKKVTNRLFITKTNTSGPHSLATATFLKNKYLYWTYEGVLDYIWANTKVIEDEVMKNAGELETSFVGTCLEKLLEKLQKNKKIFFNNNIDIVSLGCGDGFKDIDVITKNKLSILNYYLIDISPFLLLMAINNFSKVNKDFLSNLHPLLIDFFDINKLQSSQKELIFSKSRNRIFLLFGQTLANYRETDLIYEISQIMNDNDLLIVGIELINKRNVEEISSKYRNEANDSFLIRPLKMIPWFAKYEPYEFCFNPKTEKNHVLSVVGDESLIYIANITIPFIELDAIIGWSTKYDVDEIILFFETLHSKQNPKIPLTLFCYKLTSDNNYGTFALIKDSSLLNNEIEDHDSKYYDN